MSLPFIRTEQKIALACPGSRATAEDEVKAAQHYLLKNYNIHAVYAEETYRHVSAEQRAKIFLDYLFAEDVAMVWALRGGEGTADIIPFLHRYQTDIARTNPKFLVGFSDFTVLLIYFAQYYQWPVIHACGAAQLAKNILQQQSKQMTMQLLLGELSQITLPLTLINEPVNYRYSDIVAQLTGGNLTLLTLSIKDLWEFDAHDRILIIEDVNEKPHAVHRSLKYLQRIGKFDGVRAIILGDFFGVTATSETNTLQQQHAKMAEVLQYFAATCNFPVLRCQQFGHGVTNWPLPLFASATLAASTQPKQMTLVINVN